VLSLTNVLAVTLCLPVARTDAGSTRHLGVRTTTATLTGLSFTRLWDPPRTIVESGGSWLATFTDGSRTVTLRGATRTFSEAGAGEDVVSSTWVRLLPTAFNGTVDSTWLGTALADGSPDVLAIAMQYRTGAPRILASDGSLIANDADYGPVQADGTRAAGADFNDYLGRAWSYPNGTVDPAEPSELGSLDCSGFVRMVFGYRAGMPLTRSADGRGIPRTAADQLVGGPGVTVITDGGKAPAARSSLQPGDLVFFDASTVDGTRIDHVGIYLGPDTAGHDRFISSRKGANGPTLGDVNGRSILDGSGLYAIAFRAARRL
jgi:cell wall-associated NlpC family hydrolase